MDLGTKVHKSELKACPFQKGKCKGLGCMLWVRYDRADGESFETCCFVMDVILSQQQVLEQIRSQAAIESFRNVTVEGGRQLLRLAATRREIGNGE